MQTTAHIFRKILMIPLITYAMDQLLLQVIKTNMYAGL